MLIWITPAFPSIPILAVFPHLFCCAHTGSEGGFCCLRAPVCYLDCNIIVLVFIMKDLVCLSADNLFCMVKQFRWRFGTIFLKVERSGGRGFLRWGSFAFFGSFSLGWRFLFLHCPPALFLGLTLLYGLALVLLRLGFCYFNLWRFLFRQFLRSELQPRLFTHPATSVSLVVIRRYSSVSCGK